MTGTSLTAKKKDKNLSQDITRLKGFSPWAPIETFGLRGLIFIDSNGKEILETKILEILKILKLQF